MPKEAATAPVPAVESSTTPAGSGTPPRTYSQQEYDERLGAGRNEVYNALGVTADNAAGEIEAFRAWKAKRAKPPTEQPETDADKAGDRLRDMENRLTAMQRRIDAANAGIPADKTDRYIRLAASYMDDKTDFGAALSLALKDFPLPTSSGKTNAGEAPFGGAVSGSGKTDKLPDEDKIKDIFAKR